MVEEDIIDRARYLYINNYPNDLRKAVDQAVRELIDTPYIRELASIFDITIDDYVQSIFVKLSKEYKII